MQEQLGRLIVGSATGAYETGLSPARELDREAEFLLAQVPLFAALSKRHLARVASVATAKRIAAHTPLVRAGEPADAFYVILDGKARVDVPGRPIELEAGDFFGEMALIDGEPRSATVTALGEVLVLTVPRPKFLKLLEAEPTVTLALMEALTQRLREAQAAAGA